MEGFLFFNGECTRFCRGSYLHPCQPTQRTPVPEWVFPLQVRECKPHATLETTGPRRGVLNSRAGKGEPWDRSLALAWEREPHYLGNPETPELTTPTLPRPPGVGEPLATLRILTQSEGGAPAVGRGKTELLRKESHAL